MTIKGVTLKVPKKAVPPAPLREAILWILVTLCQIGYPLGPLVGQLTGLPVVAHHAPSSPIAEGPHP